MKKKNIVVGLFLSLVMILTLTGCSSKTAITKSDFTSKAEGHSYTISDATAQFETAKVVKSATIAQKSNDWQVEFYELTDSSEATSMFNTNKEKFESYKGSSSQEASVNLGSYSSYSLTSDGYYMSVSKIDNTVVYARVKENYKTEVKDFIKELGY